MTDNKNTLLCLGFGYVARALAAALPRAHWEIFGTLRGDETVREDDGVRRVRFGDAAAAIAQASHLLISIPPDTDGDPALRAHGAALAQARQLRWIGYLSTTGVYGDTGGRSVDETAPTAPRQARARRRVAAEQAWRDLARSAGLPLHIFRLAGIYGPGRNVLMQIRDGRSRRIVRPGHVFSRIHLDDLVQTVTLAMAAPERDAIYNVADDEPAEQSEVVAYGCALLGVAPPPPVAFEDALPTMSEMARSFWDDRRRIDNTKIKRVLGVRLRFPTYREGLKAVLAQGAG